MDAELLDSLEGQVALVAGGNYGPSAAVVANLESRGARTYVGYRNLRGITQPTGEVPVELDLREPDTVREAVRSVRKGGGRLDILVCDAPDLSGVSEDTLHKAVPDDETARRLYLDGPKLLVTEALDLLTERPGGRVVVVTSGGNVGEGRAEVEHEEVFEEVSEELERFVRELHEDYGSKGLMVNAVHPPEEDTGTDLATRLALLAPGGPSGKVWRKGDEVRS